MPERGPVLGFDYGRRRIGVGVAGEMGLGAQGVATVRNGLNGPDWNALDQLVARWHPAHFVVGLPLAMDGAEGPMALEARGFGRRLVKRYERDVWLVDERLSSHAAEAVLREREFSAQKRRKLVDQAAACAILETYMAWRRRGRA